MKQQALADIAIVLGVSIGAFALELKFEEMLPWGEEARGAAAVLAGAVAALWLTLGTGGSLADLGFRRPRRWLAVPFWALGIFVAFVVAQGVVIGIGQQLADIPQPDMSRYDFIRGNLPAALLFAALLPLTAAIPEEIVYRGFLLHRFAELFGGTERAYRLAVLAQALMFGSVHFQWGVGGIVFATVMGMVWGTAFLLCGRNLWIVILAHSTAHLALVLQIFLAPAPG